MENKDVYISKPWLKFYTDDAPDEVKIPEVSLYSLFDQAAEKYGKRPALIYYGKKITYLRLRNYINSFAKALASLGIKKGDIIALYLLNSPQYIISYFASLKIGAIVTSVNPDYTSKELSWQLADSGAAILVCESILYENVFKSDKKPDTVILTDICDFLPFYKRIIKRSGLNEIKKGLNRYIHLKADNLNVLKFRKLLGKSFSDIPEIQTDPQKDIACLSYSSGISGLPKAAILTHYNIAAVISQARGSFPMLADGNEVSLSYFPLYNIYGQVLSLLLSLLHGFALVLFPSMDMEEVIDAIDRYQVTVFSGYPFTFQKLSVYEKTHYIDWTRLKLIFSSADILYESIYDSWKKRTDTKILESFGMIETSGITHINPYKRTILGSFGLPLPNITAAVWNAKKNMFSSTDEIGELIIKGPGIMKGYWRRPEETKSVFIEIDKERWLRTGDLVCMNSEGYFYFFDRISGVIPFGDYFIYTREVEEVLYEYGPVKAAAVTGVKDSNGKIAGKAYIVLIAIAKGKISEEDIIEYCEDNMEVAYMIPKIIEFRGDLPRIDCGKVLRRKLQVESGEGHDK